MTVRKKELLKKKQLLWRNSFSETVTVVLCRTSYSEEVKISGFSKIKIVLKETLNMGEKKLPFDKKNLEKI